MTESPLPSTPPEPAEPGLRRLRRSRDDKVIGGVCGGLGHYLGVDPLLLRVAAVALALSGGAGVLAYVVAWVMIPDAAPDEPETVGPQADRHTVTLAVGTALVALGALLMLRAVVPWLGAGLFWALVVIGAGLLVTISARK